MVRSMRHEMTHSGCHMSQSPQPNNMWMACIRPPRHLGLENLQLPISGWTTIDQCHGQIREVNVFRENYPRFLEFREI